MINRPWTEEERAVLLQLAATGVPASEAARQLDRSRNSVLGFSNRQFGGYRVIKPVELKPLHVRPAKKKVASKPRKDGLSPTGRSTKRMEPELVEEIILPPEPLPNVEPVRMMEIGRFQCRYIVSNLSKDPNPLMCSAPVKGTGSWCPHHYNLVYNRVPPRKV